MNNTSRTNWEKVDSLTEEDIDTSDIPPLAEEFFSKSRWWKPVKPIKVLVQVDPETLAWFQTQGEDYEKKMAAALRIYASEYHQIASRNDLPTYQPFGLFPEQLEVSVKGALFPCFILGVKQIEKSHFVVNPHVFNIKNFKDHSLLLFAAIAVLAQRMHQVYAHPPNH